MLNNLKVNKLHRIKIVRRIGIKVEIFQVRQ